MEVDVPPSSFQIDGDVCFVGDVCSVEDKQFDDAVGALQECLMDPKVGEIQEEFLREHCGEFDESEENKFSYSTIHNAWVECMESVIQDYLINNVENFDMAVFGEACMSRFEEIPPDILNLLQSFTDFSVFKEQMLAYKHSASGPSFDVHVRSLYPTSSSSSSSFSSSNSHASFPMFP